MVENMNFPHICRTCLGTELLSPIFKDNNSDVYSAILYETAGLKIEKNDGLPQEMCEKCTSFLQLIVEFRKKCKEAEAQLLKMKEIFHNDKNLKNCLNVQPKAKKGKLKKSKSCTKTKCECNFCCKDRKRHKENISLSNSLTTDNDVKDASKKVKIDNLDENGLLCGNVLCKDEPNDSINCENLNNNDMKLDMKGQNDDEKSDLIQESEYSTEFLDISFNSDSKDWFLSDNTILENNYNEDSVKNIKKIKKPTTKVKKHLKTNKSKSILKSGTIVIELESKTIEGDNKTIEDDNKTIESCDKTIEGDETAKWDTIMNITEIPEIICDDLEKIRQQISTESVDENQPFEVIENRAICKICRKEMSRRSIVSHISVRHPGTDRRRQKCDYCDAYILKERMTRHRIKKHGGDGFSCTYCLQEYKNGADLMEHLPTCTQKKRQRKNKGKEAIVECEICNKSMQKSSLKTHRDIKHGGMGPVCEHCGRRMGNKLRLREHLRSRHGYEKLKCGSCEFTAASHTALTNHERRHRGEKPYVCERCGAKFHAAYLLAQHRHSHRAHKDIKCDRCPAAFKTNNTLHMHKMTCHDDTVYQCAVCPRTFKCRQYLNRHVRTLHAALRD